MIIEYDGHKETPFHLLHHLWTKAVGTPDYVKAEWVQLERCIVRLEKLEPPPLMVITEPTSRVQEPPDNAPFYAQDYEGMEE